MRSFAMSYSAPKLATPSSHRARVVSVHRAALDASPQLARKLPQIEVDNKSHPNFTKLDVKVVDFHGLMRVFTWTLNGVGVRVNSALFGSSDGVAHDQMWVTDLSGKKLSDDAADALADRLIDYVEECMPCPGSDKTEVYSSGQFHICNKAHPEFTQITILGEPPRPGFLSELASVLTGIGCDIHQSVIMSSPDCPFNDPRLNASNGCAVDIDAVLLAHDFTKGRVFRFWVTDQRKEKLDYGRMSSLLFTLRLLEGKGHMPTVPPNKEFASGFSRN